MAYLPICAVTKIVVERQWLDIAEKHCVRYSLFRLKKALQRSGYEQTVAVDIISVVTEIIYSFQHPRAVC